MPQVTMLAPGQTGFTPVGALFCTQPGKYPAILRALYTILAEAGPDALPVYNNPLTRKFEVTIRKGVKALHNTKLITNVAGFFYVILILPNGDQVEDRIPDCYWQSAR